MTPKAVSDIEGIRRQQDTTPTIDTKEVIAA
jgi:hypothetical protein